MTGFFGATKLAFFGNVGRGTIGAATIASLHDA